jgi:hypothetical protein
LTNGTFVYESLLAKPKDSTDALWTNAPTGGACKTYVFQYNSLTSGTPGNPQITNHGPCATTNPNTTMTYGWYLTGETGLWWHGVIYDQMVILPTGFKIHSFGPIIWNGILQSGEYWETYRRL